MELPAGDITFPKLRAYVDGQSGRCEGGLGYSSPKGRPQGRRTKYEFDPLVEDQIWILPCGFRDGLSDSSHASSLCNGQTVGWVHAVRRLELSPAAHRRMLVSMNMSVICETDFRGFLAAPFCVFKCV